MAGELAWAYHQQGRFEDAASMNRIALANHPDELWIQFDLGLSLLAAGQVDAAKVEYAKGMDFAAKQVADAHAAGQEVPWDLGASGTAEKPLSLAYSDVFVLNPGQYTVEMYVNSHLVQHGSFVIEDAGA